jgi:putative transposase
MINGSIVSKLGLDGLRDLSRAPYQHPNQTERAVAESLIAARQAHPTWGPKKLVAWLRDREPWVPWPAPSTVGGLLDRAGLVRRRKQRRRTAPWSQPFVQAEQPNDLWCIDFKGWFRTGDGRRIDPITVEDASSGCLAPGSGERFSGIRSPAYHPNRQRPTICQRGPWRIVVPVGVVGEAGDSPRAYRAGHPEQNGRLERLHRTLKAETANPPQPTWQKQQRAFQDFRSSYNQERPHEALDQQPPARRYRPSVRAYPKRVESPEYETGDQWRNQVEWW